VARHGLTGVLLVGGASRRFGSPKALAQLNGETLAERGWRVLGEACDERIAVGKTADALPLPFPVLDDGSRVRPRSRESSPACARRPTTCASSSRSTA
jgi:molybdopterin-guanine dinucleotide biosynthesis protein A